MSLVFWQKMMILPRKRMPRGRILMEFPRLPAVKEAVKDAACLGTMEVCKYRTGHHYAGNGDFSNNDKNWQKEFVLKHSPSHLNILTRWQRSREGVGDEWLFSHIDKDTNGENLLTSSLVNMPTSLKVVNSSPIH